MQYSENEERNNQERGGVKRIPSFIKRLNEATLYGDKGDYSKADIAMYRKSVNALCKAEIAYMRKQLQTDSDDYSVQTLHRYISDYRNAVRNEFKGQTMPDMYGDSRGYKVKTHIAVKYLSMTKAEKEARKQRDIDSKNQYTDIDTGGRLIIANPQDLITIANQTLKESTDYFKIVAALLAVTGRRPIEILHTGNLTPATKNPQQCTFTGQAKTRESEHARGAFDIYTLAPPKLVCEALARIRKMKQYKDLSHRHIESRTSGTLGVKVRDLFGDVLAINGVITPKSLRGIWVNVAHHIFKPMSIDSVFATNQLGHATPNGQSVSRASADNYMQFFCYPLTQEKISELLHIIA